MRKNIWLNNKLYFLMGMVIFSVIYFSFKTPSLPISRYVVKYSTRIYTSVRKSPAVRKISNYLISQPADRLTFWDGNGSPALGSKKISEIDNMVSVFIPAGTFLMGSSDEQSLEIERPQRQIYLDEYWIDQVPVTNAMYRRCMQSGVCEQPASIYPEINAPEFNEYPVVYITWYAADEYCHWVGGKLPSEAMWEKAARGTDGRLYPWGNQKPEAYLLNFNNNIGSPSIVGSYPEGASPYGVLDMAGNVREWMDDWFSESYFFDVPEENPTGPENGTYKALRGGSFSDGRDIVRSTTRLMHVPDSPGINRGFRCVRQ